LVQRVLAFVVRTGPGIDRGFLLRGLLSEAC
jgi:hypothetical protein